MPTCKQSTDPKSRYWHMTLIMFLISGVIAGCEYCAPLIAGVFIYEIIKMFRDIQDSRKYNIEDLC